MKRTILIIILVVAGVAGWYAYTEYNRTTTSLDTIKETARLEAPSLLTQYETDSATASRQFNEKIIAVTGTIKKIEGESNPVIVFLGDPAQMSSVQCSMDSTNATAYKSLKNGSTVTIKGQVTGFRTDPLFGTDVILNRCVVSGNP